MRGDRKGYYLRPGGGVTVPKVLFSVGIDAATETRSESAGLYARSWRSAVVCTARRAADGWGKVTRFRCSTPADLWGLLHTLAVRRARNYVVAPCASDALTLAGWWGLIHRAGVVWEPTRAEVRKGNACQIPPDVYRIRRLVLRGKPDIIDFAHRDRRWVWLSGEQYLPIGEEEIARSIGYVWPETGSIDWRDNIPLRSAGERAELWIRAVMRLADWWKANSTAPWGLTVGQLAVGILRSHIGPKSLCTHNQYHAHQLERDASFGARATAWYIGDIGQPAAHETDDAPAPPPSSFGMIRGPVYQVDVRSMYPWLLRDRPYPVKLISVRGKQPPFVPGLSTNLWGVLACVTIRTNAPEYPVRKGERVEFPTGQFTTVLTGPELDRLRQDGRVVRCHRLCLYAMGRPFERAAGELIDMREAARSNGDKAWELFAKLLANSMGGKLAQKSGHWRATRKIPAKVEWGEWIDGMGKGGKVKKCRALAGLVWEYVHQDERSGPFTAAYAYLTAYGRLHMRELREKCRPGSVISQDTDGLWVTRDGLDDLERGGAVFGNAAGELRVTDEVPAARFYGPRHYWTPGGWTLAGFTRPRVARDGVTVTDTYMVNPIRACPTDAPDETLTVSRSSKLVFEAGGGTVDGFGWVHPPYRRPSKITGGRGS